MVFGPNVRLVEAPPTGDDRPMRIRDLALIALATASGVVVAWIDSRPGWDDTGITAALLVLAAAAVTAVSGRRPWLWALLVGAWTPAVEITAGGSAASLIAIGFAAVGAMGGWLLARSAAGVQHGGTRSR
jgi:hypothetical protein